MVSMLLSLIACAGQTLELQDGQNYAYTGEMTVPTVPTASGVDIELCWDQLSSDLACHDLDAAEDIDLLALIRFPHLSEEEVELGISNDDLTQSQLDGYVALETSGETCASLAAFDFFGTPIDVPAQYNSEGGTYLLMLSTGTTPGQGARMLTFLDPTTDSDVTRVDVGDGCGLLDFSADLGSLNQVPVEPEGPWTVDWSAVTTNGAGNDFEPGHVDQVTVGFYEGLTTADLEARFLDLELIATKQWTLQLTEVRSFVELGDATSDGQPLSSLDGEGAWILALRCSTCSNPAPLFLTVLAPEAE